MKTRTEQEYLAHQFLSPREKSYEWRHEAYFNHYGLNGSCSCTQYLGSRGLKAWDECPQCFGYGYMPIPWSEIE